MNTKPNSIESISAGFDMGADITEIDIRFTSDGVPVLSHDDVNNKAIFGQKSKSRYKRTKQYALDTKARI